MTEEYKKSEAFKIIKNKEVIMPDFMEAVQSFNFTYNHYINYEKNYSYKKLTEEEFNLLKEMLGEEKRLKNQKQSNL